MKKIYTTIDNKNEFVRSRWISVRSAYDITPRHSLYEWATDESGYRSYQDKFNPTNGTYLDYFIYGGRKYALDQFVGLGSVWCSIPPYEILEDDGKSSFIGAVDFNGDLYNPLYIEISEHGDMVRVYEEV